MLSQWLVDRAAMISAAALTITVNSYAAFGQTAGRPPLGQGEIGDIARLEMLEDRRQFDSTELVRLLGASHPEVRRRAALTVARLADRRGVALLRGIGLEPDTAIAATVAFAVGQLRDTLTIPWFDSLLANPRTAPTLATEAATALGKLKTGAARAALARFLAGAVPSARTNGTIGEALLSIGRSTARGDIAPIVRFTTSSNEEVRWRATWALFRPRDPTAVAALLALSGDRSPVVRSWAVRGLTRAQADSANLGARAESRLVDATRDPDRRVRTEAIRALATYPDSTAASVLVRALDSPDSWISVTAAEGLGRLQSPATVSALLAATKSARSCAARVSALQALQSFAVQDASIAAKRLVQDSAAYCRTTAFQTIARDTSRSLASRRADLAASDSAVRVATLRAMSAWSDSTDLPFLLDAYDRAQADPASGTASAAASAIAAIQRRQGVGASQFFARFSPPANPMLRRDVDRAFGAAARQAWTAVVPPLRSDGDYRAIVERWIVPAYNGRANPTSRWETSRGALELELYAADAPLAVDYFVRVVESGAIVGTEFTRVVADFVDQQAPIRGGSPQRDEVNRHRLTRANLSWATAGLDTGSPGYTLNHTPQPHNEGDFTSVGRVVRGMDVVDRIELGDRVTAATIRR